MNWPLQLHTRTAAADLREQIKTEDMARDGFMKGLDARYRSGRVRVTEFETTFLATWANSPQSNPYWTPRRRETADELKRKYS